MSIHDRTYPLGLVLWIVINNKEFDYSFHQLREGAEVDEINLKEALLPFEVDLRVWQNYKRQDILNSLRAIKEEVDNVPDKFSGLVILGMSHGEERDGRDYLVTSDCKPLLIETIVALYHNEFCIGLKDRPKCFLFNMCRGAYPNVQIQKDGTTCLSLADHDTNCSESNSSNQIECCHFSLPEESFLSFDDETMNDHSQIVGTDLNQSQPMKENKEDVDQDQRTISFKKGDYMIVHSTLKGYVSNRHKQYGTIFIQELTKSINELMRCENHNFEEVIRRTCFAASSHRFSGINASQLPEFTTTLRAPFRFILKGICKIHLQMKGISDLKQICPIFHNIYF